MNIIDLRKYFYNSRDFVIRLRDDKDIVYYNGIRAMYMSHPNKENEKEKYELVPSVYRLNKAFLISEKVQKDLQVKKYEKVLTPFLELRNHLMNEDEMLKIIKHPKIIITRENHRKEDSLKDERRVVSELLQELEEHKLSEYLTFSIVKEYVLEDLSHITYEDIEKLKQELYELFHLDCKIFCTKRHWRTLKKEKKDFKIEIKKKTFDKEYYEYLKQSHSLDLVEVHFLLEKKTPIQIFKDNYLSLTDFNQNLSAHKLFNKWEHQYLLKDTIEICINKDTSMPQMLLIELLVLKNWILDKDCNYIDTNKIHRRKPEVKIFQCPKKLVEELDLKKLEDIVSKIKKGIEHYELSKYESEKNYQHQFMLDEKVVDKLKDVLKLDHSEVLYSFEEEYYTSDTENEEEDDNEKLGRIDNVFLGIHKDHSIDVYLIELKYNELALGGTNGLHTHLNDIKKLFRADYHKFEESLKEVIDHHLTIVHDMLPDTKLPTSICKICRYHFLIVIGYEKEKKDKIINILNTYNDADYYKKIDDEKYDEVPVPKVNKSKLYKSTLKELRMEIPEEKCDVQLFLDEVYKDNEKNEVQITDKPLEKYEL